MPYTQLQKQYLEAMGMVPWALRDSDSVTAITTVSAEQSVSLIENAGNCSVLLVFPDSLSHADKPLSSAENRLLLDMFGAIQLKDSSVARRHLPVDTSADVSEVMKPLLSESVKVVLIAVRDAGSAIGDEAASSKLLASGLNTPVWQIPHPSWIQQEPVLKRRAWNVLKAARETLQASVSA